MGCSTSIKTVSSANSPIPIPAEINSPAHPQLSQDSVTNEENSPIPNPAEINSPTHPQRSQDSVTNEQKGQQRAQAQDLVQDYLLLWLDGNLDESNEDFRNSIKRLRLTVDTIETFRDADECLKYISSFKNEKAFLIVSGALTKNVVPRTHVMPQIYAIYIFCRERLKYEQWATKEWPKVRGVFTNIDSICTSVRQAARGYDDDAVGITGEIESSFMYTTLFKEIVLEINFDEKIGIPDLANYARQQEAKITFKIVPSSLHGSGHKYSIEFDETIFVHNDYPCGISGRVYETLSIIESIIINVGKILTQCSAYM
ncbi:unnamed protein product [Rotaria sp. Silwood1]|nr:unnamed protein product [Rotaria sp. Silwood1]CAF4757023.1 unnamed protein product [Rotaria sp. Silwood1]